MTWHAHPFAAALSACHPPTTAHHPPVHPLFVLGPPANTTNVIKRVVSFFLGLQLALAFVAVFRNFV